MPTLTVSAKVVGSKNPAIPDFDIPLPFERQATRDLTLRDLLEHLVTREVEAFTLRQGEQRLAQMLSAGDIAHGARLGKIVPGEREPGAVVDAATAVAVALQAFDDGLYFVFLDGAQRESLAEIVEFGEASRLLIVRLTPLAGG